MRGAPVSDIHGPFIHAPVWSWEVAAYFWFGGMASGSAFVALACDVAGDHRSAAIARKVALGAVAPAPVLLIADLGRPERFLNMMRIFKPRSPMNTGAWCLVAFSGSECAGGGVADLAGRPQAARALGALTSLLGSYLGSYTGVLLACTAVPVWARSRTILGPAFVATATATGAAATRLVLVASGLPHGPPDAQGARHDRDRLDARPSSRISALGERRLGDAADGAAPRARRASTSVPPRASSRSGSRCGWSRAVRARASTTSPASCISRPAWRSASPGSPQESPPRRTTPPSRRWAAADARCTRTVRSHGNSAPSRPAAPRCRCPTSRDGLRRSGQAHQPRDRAAATALTRACGRLWARSGAIARRSVRRRALAPAVPRLETVAADSAPAQGAHDEPVARGLRVGSAPRDAERGGNANRRR